MKTIKLKIKSKNKTYPVFIGNNIIKKTSNYINTEIATCKKIAILIDTNVPVRFVNVLKRSLKNFNITLIKFKSSEKEKKIKNVLKIVNLLLNKNFHRNDCIITIGGGIVGDVGAFTASIIKRGIKFVNIPSTLLSQVDSSIGGKTGVNSNYGKNLIGTFFQPDIVISDISILDSLPKREIICGYAEILKHSIIFNKKFFFWLINNSNYFFKFKDKELIQKTIFESCKIKSKVIEKDEKENNYRKILNFGHTFAHAFESAKNFSKNLNHGEAVLIGMICACEFAFEKKILKIKEINIIKNHYKKFNLPQNIKNYFKKKDINKIVKFMKSDKKNYNNKINLVIIKKIGKIPKIITCNENQMRIFLKKKLN